MSNTETPSSSGLGWLALICGILTNVVLLFAGYIYIAMPNANVPLVIILFLVVTGWVDGYAAMKSGKYILAISGILLSLPAVAVFLWVLCNQIVPFYVQWIKGGWYSIP